MCLCFFGRGAAGRRVCPPETVRTRLVSAETALGVQGGSNSALRSSQLAAAVVDSRVFSRKGIVARSNCSGPLTRPLTHSRVPAERESQCSHASCSPSFGLRAAALRENRRKLAAPAKTRPRHASHSATPSSICGATSEQGETTAWSRGACAQERAFEL